ncbi:MAG: aspartyl/glutamyl-tRNA amidotransferase subunit A [Burkholderiales bacterium]|nr:aspartyl/glutamyl-tRNA amidotransferase subunit A [Burkholderiales bacterium]
MHQHSLRQLSALLQSKQISATELAQHYLNRIEGNRYNAFTHVDHAMTLAQAADADQRLTQGNAPLLAGIPIAHKDIFVTRGWRSTAGSKMLANYVSPFDAAVVERFQQAGMVTLGKLNCDEFAMGSANENSFFGAVKNPWDTSAVPGGSSGGSAAAIAARLAPAVTGTDTGGSIRQPASFCGITGVERATEDFSRDLNQSLKGLKIGVPREFFGAGLAADVEQAVRGALAEYEKLGATLVDISLPKTELSIPVYYIIAPAEASSNLSRFDGVRYGHRAADYKDLNDMYRKSRTEGFGDEVKRRILTGAYVLSHGYYDAYYLQAQKIRRLIAQDFQAAFAQCDVIMGPVAPTVAWDLGDKSDDPVANYLADIFTLSTSLAGLPGMSIPCGFGQGEKNSKRPVGLQIIGNYFAEAKILNVAHQFQLATDWHTRAPENR